MANCGSRAESDPLPIFVNKIDWNLRLSHYKSRNDYLQVRLHGLQSQKYLLHDSLQKKLANTQAKELTNFKCM